MPSRLSSLLVRDGLVGVKRMEKAFQRQVIYGGSLDTTLLEMGLVPEDRLTQYLALASGLPPATRQEANVFDVEAVRLCPQDLAIRYRVVPLCLENGSLRVLVHDPVDMGLLEELADQLDVPVQPLIAPEYRWHVVFTRNYGGQPTARFSTLARTADASPITSPVGRARTVIVEPEEHQVVDVPLKPVGPEAVTMRMPAMTEDAVAPAPVDPAASGELRRPRTTQTIAVAPPPRAATDAAPPPALELTAEERTTGELAVPVIAARRTAELSTPAMQAHFEATEAQRVEAVERRRDSGPHREASGPTSDGVPTRPLASGNTPDPARSGPVRRLPTTPSVADVPDDDSPIGAPAARAVMSGAADRDKVFFALLRGLRSRTRWAGLLTVQGGAAIGRVALAEHGLDVTAMPSVLIPLDLPSPFQATAGARHPYVGPIATGTPDLDVMVARMGGVVPPAALVLPILLRDRCVALAVAHRGREPLTLADVTELLPLGTAVAENLGRLIVRQKSAGFRVPTTPGHGVPVTEVPADDVATKKAQRAPTKGWAVPPVAADASLPTIPATAGVTAALEPALGVAGTIELPAPTPIAALLDDVEGDDDARVEAALADAVRRAGEVVALLPARFPGRLRVDRYQVSGRALRPGQYGGLLELVVRLGSMTSDLLLEKMGDPRRDVRFYATVCATAIRPRSAVYALVERLFDADYGVRACAIEALSGYPLRDLDLGMIRARHALHSEDLERVGAAANAIAELADTHAIPDLIDIVGKEARRAQHARHALVALTRQDHGTSERKWRKWWDEHKFRHRIEWLIDALSHKDGALRGGAAEDLRRLTGENFGVSPEGGRRDRDAARERWVTWWNETGRRRFLRDDDEKLRATATLPVLQRRD
ncbi:MAG TPA: hypothetical protein VM734_02425 [Kofleriaceae bacterium]|nr:hypothetical protein [Kofleriaceae bacterium]